jgi:spore germination protein YaaH
MGCNALQRTNHSFIGKWVVILTAFLLLGGSCIGSVLVVFGGYGKARAANLEATSLADAEVTELVGSASYTRSDAPSSHTFFRAIAEGLHIPFTDPARMLTSELPETVDNLPGSSTMQSSMFGSISTWAKASGKITVGWATDASPWTTEQLLVNNPGVSVLCPTWLQLSSANGSVTSHVEDSVITFAHKRNVKVWALIDNQFSRKLTRVVLSSPDATNNLIEQITQVATKDHLDGINIDFENLDPADRDRFTGFMASLHKALSPKGIDLSVDITPDIVMLNDDAEFFHAGLASYCDHIILMAYDEHWSTDPEPGPVADVPWVTNSVYDLLDTGVPTDKLILGIPFYARFWYVHHNGSVTSTAVSGGSVDEILKSHHATGAWDDSLGVMYAKYPQQDGYGEVWYENDKTLLQKLKLVNDAGLEGAAVWTLQLSDTKTWTNLVQALRQSVS